MLKPLMDLMLWMCLVLFECLWLLQKCIIVLVWALAQWVVYWLPPGCIMRSTEKLLPIYLLHTITDVIEFKHIPCCCLFSKLMKLVQCFHSIFIKRTSVSPWMDTIPYLQWLVCSNQAAFEWSVNGDVFWWACWSFRRHATCCCTLSSVCVFFCSKERSVPYVCFTELNCLSSPYLSS